METGEERRGGVEGKECAIEDASTESIVNGTQVANLHTDVVVRRLFGATQSIAVHHNLDWAGLGDKLISKREMNHLKILDRGR